MRAFRIKAKEKFIDFTLYTFAKHVLKYSKLQEVHEKWCEKLDTSHKRKLFLMPRGTFKSSLITIAYPLWKLIQNPNERILIANATSENAEAFLREISSHIIRNERFKSLFGDLIDPRAAKISSITLKDRKSYHKEPSISTIGVLGNLVSAHYSTIICDDLCNQQDRESDSVREKKKRWYHDLLSVLDPDGEIIVVGTKWHYQDLYHYIVDELNPKLPPEEQYYINIESCYEEDGITPKFPTILPTEVLDRLKIEKGNLEFSCTPKETPILMSDWTLKPISEIKDGEFVMGWEDGIKTKNSKLKPSKVVGNFNKIDSVYDLIMESGEKVRCTKDHRWYNQKGHSRDKKIYTPPRRGRYLYRVFPLIENNISEQERRDWCYLAGIIDGEGSLKSSSSITLSQSHIKNPDVYNKIIDVLKRLKIEYNETERKHKNEKWHDSRFLWLKNSIDVKFKLLKYTDIGKREQIINSIYKHGTRFILNRDRLNDIVYTGTERVYALETETGNYVAWGYGSSNSQYINIALPQESQIFFETDFKTFTWLGGTRIKDGDKEETLSVVGYCDLSLGKSKSSDYTAIATVGKGKDGTIYLIDVSLQRVPPDKTIKMIFEKHKVFDYKQFGVESNVFQSLFGDSLKKASAEKGALLPVVDINHNSNKALRIQSLQPIIKQGLLKIRDDWRQDKEYKELINQFIYFPMYGFDDGPDSVEGAVSLLKKGRGWEGAPFGRGSSSRINVSGMEDFDMKKFEIPEMRDPSSNSYGMV